MAPVKWRVALVRISLAAVAGLAMVAAFPPYDVPILAPAAVALNAAAVRRTTFWRGAALGLLTGAVFFGVLLRWLSVVGPDAWALLAGFCALWFGLLGGCLALVTRLRWWPVWVACLWVLQEALRDRIPLGGFPWGRLAFAETASTLTGLASIGGAPLVTWAAALAGGLGLAAALRLRRPTRGVNWSGPWPWALACLGVLLVGVVVPRPVDGPVATLAVVQGNVPTPGLGSMDERRVVLENHVRETLALAQRVQSGQVAAPDVVIWPENSSDLDPYADPSVAAEITAAAAAVGAPILVGAVVDSPKDPALRWNVGIVWDPVTGPGEYYVKTRPVPFGEYVPFRDLLSDLIGRFDRIPRDFDAGSEPGVLSAGGVVLGDVICFEVAYDDTVRNAVVAGAQVVVVQTNNATFAGTGQPEQQVAMSRLRAVEHGRSVAVAATSGISAVIDPRGGVLGSLPEMVPGSLVFSVPMRSDLTLADRLGVIPEAALAAMGAGAVIVVLVVSRRRRTPAQSGGQQVREGADV